MKIVVLISANAEWRAVKQIISAVHPQPTLMGESFLADIGFRRLCFFHGGWGKISAAATTQYVVDHLAPDLLVNLGTCGGFAGRIDLGETILAEKTIVYDIIEQMSDPDEAIAHYATDLDLSWLKQPYPHPIRRGLLLSADRDIVLEDIAQLIGKFNAVAADWESGAIAWVAKRNSVPLLILRGVTDLVGADGGEAYGNIALFQERTKAVMQELIGQIPDWLNRVGSGD
jgi:adenosylhomocysteine nucleosidase